MPCKLDLFQVNEYTWMAMESVSDRSYRIVQQHNSYGIFYEGISSPGIRPVRTHIENFEIAKIYLAYILRKEKKRCIQ